MITEEQEKKGKIILTIAISIIMISIGLQTVKAYEQEDYNFDFEYINTKDMADVEVKEKSDVQKNYSLISLLVNNTGTSGEVEEVPLENKEVEEVQIQPTNNAEITREEPKRIWYLPTEMGSVSQFPHYGHAAYDITSPRGSNEPIFPVANGTITNIYRDLAGALVVTVLHDIDGKKYTSQYAHLSSFASNIYIGKPVTVNDSLGLMGTTGNSTGVHLHFALVDCALYDPNDYNCRDLNGFFRYANTRINQGYFGLGKHIYVPYNWNSR